LKSWDTLLFVEKKNSFSREYRSPIRNTPLLKNPF
jgi:hypothetical protein